ncbi:MAG: hypothetical protein H0V23_02250 [Nocardioidaceae bacterium]|nr:hypothetical protein [Nocardioidaceae bacterium]
MTSTTATFTPTPLCQPWCVEHEAHTSDYPQSPHIWHWGTQVEVDCSNGTTVHMRLTRYTRAASKTLEPAQGVTSVAIASWPTVPGTPELPLDDRGIPQTDARVVAIALAVLADTGTETAS